MEIQKEYDLAQCDEEALKKIMPKIIADLVKKSGQFADEYYQKKEREQKEKQEDGVISFIMFFPSKLW